MGAANGLLRDSADPRSEIRGLVAGTREASRIGAPRVTQLKQTAGGIHPERCHRMGREARPRLGSWASCILTARRWSSGSPRPARRPTRRAATAKPFDLQARRAELRRRARAARRAARASRPSCSTAAWRRSRSGSRQLKGHPGRDQQVGLLVQPVPGRVPRLPAARHRARQARSRSSASTPATRRTRRASSCASTRSRSRPTRTRTRTSRARSRRPRTTPSRSSWTRRARPRSSTRAATRPSSDARGRRRPLPRDMRPRSASTRSPA